VNGILTQPNPNIRIFDAESWILYTKTTVSHPMVRGTEIYFKKKISHWILDYLIKY